MRGWLGAVIMLCAVVSFASLADPAQAQITEAQVIQQCKDRMALPNASWTYKTAFVGFNALEWNVQNPFLGRNSGEVHVELTVSAAANFTCTPDLNGGNPQNLPSFTIPVTPRGVAYLGDIKACAMEAGTSILIVGFVRVCPFSLGPDFPDIAQFTGDGPYTVTSGPLGSTCTVFRPAQFDANRRHPIVIWGNGTGGSPQGYASLLEYFASYGFVVAAANTPNSGTGDEMIACLDALLADARRTDSPFHRKINPYRVAAAGHSQGGGGAIMAGRDPRVSATAPLMPYILPIGGVVRHDPAAHAFQHGHMLLISGALDPLATPNGHQKPVFDSVTVPVFWGQERSTGHQLTLPVARAALPFLRWRLMQHEQMGRFFAAPCALCSDPNWIVQTRMIP